MREEGCEVKTGVADKFCDRSQIPLKLALTGHGSHWKTLHFGVIVAHSIIKKVAPVHVCACMRVCGAGVLGPQHPPMELPPLFPKPPSPSCPPRESLVAHPLSPMVTELFLLQALGITDARPIMTSTSFTPS